MCLLLLMYSSSSIYGVEILAKKIAPEGAKLVGRDFCVRNSPQNPGYTAHPTFRVSRMLDSQPRLRWASSYLQSVTITHYSLKHDAFWSELIQISG